MVAGSLTDAEFVPVNVDANGNFIFTAALDKLRRMIFGIHNKIFPVYVMNPPLNGPLLGNTVSATATNSVLATVSTTKRTFITAASLTNASNVTADNTSILLYVAPILAANNRVICALQKVTLTAFAGSNTVQFIPPLELKKGSDLSFTNAFTVGASQTTVILLGYETD